MPHFSRRHYLTASRLSSFNPACCGLWQTGMLRDASLRPRSSGGDGRTALPTALHPPAGGWAGCALFFLPCARCLSFHNSPPSNFVSPDSVLELEKCFWSPASENLESLVKTVGHVGTTEAGPVRSQSNCCQLICFWCCINICFTLHTTRIIYSVLLTFISPPCP